MKKLALFALCTMAFFAVACGGNHSHGNANAANKEHDHDHEHKLGFIEVKSVNVGDCVVEGAGQRRDAEEQRRRPQTEDNFRFRQEV